jgi:BirA family biotin operon repressor/biotin-[acetyl-CoA-carboxylase] ligase
VRGASLDVYDLPALDASLAGTDFAGKLHFSPVTDSTNTDALAAARSGAPHGSVYFADEQRAGRGRGDHAWHSAAGEGLYASVLLRTPIPAARLPLLPLAVGLAAAEAIRAVAGLTIDLDLRWPNDLMIGPRKVGGILVESKISGGAAEFIVVGIGINVHQRAFDSDLSTSASHFARSGSGLQSFAAGFARLPVKIAGVRDASDARSSGDGHDSRARRAGFDLDSRATR